MLGRPRCTRRSPDAEAILVPDGERFKTLPTVGTDLRQRCCVRPRTRSAAIVTFGGGVVSDMGGFAAATYLRGIALAHVPTTLLAQVDAAIGGKVGVNLPGGKNLVGAFYQPSARRRRPGAARDAAPPRVPGGPVRGHQVRDVVCDGDLFRADRRRDLGPISRGTSRPSRP